MVFFWSHNSGENVSLKLFERFKIFKLQICLRYHEYYLSFSTFPIFLTKSPVQSPSPFYILCHFIWVFFTYSILISIIVLFHLRLQIVLLHLYLHVCLLTCYVLLRPRLYLSLRLSSFPCMSYCHLIFIFCPVTSSSCRCDGILIPSISLFHPHRAISSSFMSWNIVIFMHVLLYLISLLLSWNIVIFMRVLLHLRVHHRLVSSSSSWMFCYINVSMLWIVTSLSPCMSVLSSSQYMFCCHFISIFSPSCCIILM